MPDAPPRAVMEGEPLILVPCVKPWRCRGCGGTVEAKSLHYREPGSGGSPAKRWCVACVEEAREEEGKP